MKKKHKYTFILELVKGDIVKINGIPHEYLGNSLVGSNTNALEQVDWEGAVESSKEIENENKRKKLVQLVNDLHQLIHGK